MQLGFCVLGQLVVGACCSAAQLSSAELSRAQHPSPSLWRNRNNFFESERRAREGKKREEKERKLHKFWSLGAAMQPFHLGAETFLVAYSSGFFYYYFCSCSLFLVNKPMFISFCWEKMGDLPRGGLQLLVEVRGSSRCLWNTLPCSFYRECGISRGATHRFTTVSFLTLLLLVLLLLLLLLMAPEEWKDFCLEQLCLDMILYDIIW